jgi:hypothetical protein
MNRLQLTLFYWKRQYQRLTWFTKVLLLLVVFDLAAPGWLVFGIPGVATLDFSRIPEVIAEEVASDG